MKNVKLLDGYSKTGTDVDDFDVEISELADSTVCERKDLSKFTYLSVIGKTKGMFIVIYLSPDFIENFESGLFFSFQNKSLDMNQFTKKLTIDWMVKTFGQENVDKIEIGSLLILENKKICLVSDMAYKTLLLRLNIGADGLRQNFLARNVLLAKMAYECTGLSTCTYRTSEAGGKKLMAVPSGKYTYIPQTILSEVIGKLDLGKIECSYYYVDNRMSRIYLSFPEKANEISRLYGLKNKLIPGVYLATSDTADCSITARALFLNDGATFSIGEIARKHEGDITSDSLLEDIERVVFPQFTIIPNKLISLSLIEVDKPKEVLKSVFREAGLVSMIGKNREVMVYNELCDEFDLSLNYTAYDLAMICLTLPKRITELSTDSKNKLERGIIKVLDCNYAPDTTNNTSKKVLAD